MKIETIGTATLYQGDCLEIMGALPPFEAVITDPPYGINESARKNNTRGGLCAPTDYGDDNWDQEPIGLAHINEIKRLGKTQVIFGGNYFDGLGPTRCWLVWDKLNGDNDFADCELAWTNLDKAVRRIRYLWAGMLQQNMKDKERRYHLTQKPVAVMEWCIRQAGNPSTILDPFMGSGTTGVAAVQMGLAFTGIEISPKYFDIACQRIDQAQRQGRLFA